MPDNLKPIHCLGFFLCAFARGTDNDFDNNEIRKVFEIMQKYTPKTSEEDFKIIFNDTLTWFVGEWDAGKESFSKILQGCLKSIKNIFNNAQDEMKILFVNDVVSLAKADGKILDSEISWIHNLCEVIEIDVPSFEDNNSNDESSKEVNSKEGSELIALLVSGNVTIEQVEKFINKFPDKINNTNPSSDNYTALHYAAWDGFDDIVKFLIDNKASVNFVGSDERTPIHLATANNHVECVKLLIDGGAEIDLKVLSAAEENIYHGEKGSTPLRDAVLNQCWSIVDILLDKGADINILKDPCKNSSYNTSNFMENVKLVGENEDSIKNRHNPERINDMIKMLDSEGGKIQGNDNESTDANSSDNKDYPAISIRFLKDENGKKDTKTQKLAAEYMLNWQEKTETYCRRMGITAKVPDFFDSINKNCPKWTNKEIEKINNFITKYKVIPSVGFNDGGFIPQDFMDFTKQVWWLVPFVIWKEDTASWIFIDKNGLYAPHPNDNDGTLIASWDKILDIDLDWEEDNLAILTLEMDGGHLTFSEFVSEGCGSYLSVIESIYYVYKKTIEVSDHCWYHGAGGEGYKGFNSQKELLDEEIWKAVKPTNPAFYGYSPSKPPEIQDLLDKMNGNNELDKEELLLIWKKIPTIEEQYHRDIYNLFFKQKYFEYAIDMDFEGLTLDFYKSFPVDFFGSTYYISENKFTTYDHLQGLSEVTGEYAQDESLKEKIGNLTNIFKNIIKHPNYLERYNIESPNYSASYEDTWLKFLAVNKNDNPMNFVTHKNWGLRELYTIVLSWKAKNLIKSMLNNPNCPSYALVTVADFFNDDQKIMDLVNNHPNYKDESGKVKWIQTKALIWDDKYDSWLEDGDWAVDNAATKNVSKKEITKSESKDSKKDNKNKDSILTKDHIITILNDDINEKFNNVESKRAKSGLISYYLDKKKFLQIAPYSKNRVEFLILRDSQNKYFRPQIEGLEISNIRKYDPNIDSYKKPWGYMFYKVLIEPKELNIFKENLNDLFSSSYDTAKKNLILKVDDNNHNKLGPIFDGSFTIDKK